MWLKQRLIRILGSRVISDFAIRATSQRLRIVAYHGIPDPKAFERHLIEYKERFEPVAGEQVAAALQRATRLPDRALRLTFDDGHPEVEAEGRPLLERYGVTATMYVCPGVIATTESFWWETVRVAERLHVVRRRTEGSSRPLESKLKMVPDSDRRVFVSELADRIEERLGRPHVRDQLSTSQVRAWAGAGQELGNHTWDHPLLDQCDDAEQLRQIRDAHEWIAETAEPATWSFAYPNGNWAHAAEQELSRRGYATALGLDPHLTRYERADSLRLSRLRLDTDVPQSRLLAVTSGVHSALMSARMRFTHPRSVMSDPRALPSQQGLFR